MAEAPKVMVVVDYVAQTCRVYSNLPNLMVEAEELRLEGEEGELIEDDERTLEQIKGEYPYLQFGEEPNEDDA